MEATRYLRKVLERQQRIGLSDAELCRRAKIAQTTLMRMKFGRSSPTIRTMDKIEAVIDEYEQEKMGRL